MLPCTCSLHRNRNSGLDEATFAVHICITSCRTPLMLQSCGLLEGRLMCLRLQLVPSTSTPVSVGLTLSCEPVLLLYRWAQCARGCPGLPFTERHPGSTLLGFKGGPGGILAKDYMEITQDNMVSSNLDRRREASHHQAAALRILD